MLFLEPINRSSSYRQRSFQNYNKACRGRVDKYPDLSLSFLPSLLVPPIGQTNQKAEGKSLGDIVH